MSEGSASDPNNLSLATDAASDTLVNPRLSDDGGRPATSPKGALLNGHPVENPVLGIPDERGALDSHVEHLQAELEKTRQEKDSLATQYNNLLAKLQTMRTTLGNKLQQDAVCVLKCLSVYCWSGSNTFYPGRT
jgi:hypothetical protein